MGVDYRVILAVGRVFDSSREAYEFLKEYDVFNDTNDEGYGSNGLEEMLYGLVPTPDGSTLNCYTGWGFYLGFDLSISSPEAFQQSYEHGMKNWKRNFPGESVDVIKTVKIY